jgi:3-deoxy-D-manno-octulosonic-acid transferase
VSRLIYILLSYLLLPFLAIYLLWRSRKQPEYREHWGERFAWTAPKITPGSIWIHAVSLGETLAAESLVKALRRLYPERPLLLTHTTPTGRAAGLKLAAGVEQLAVMYLPYDTPWAVKRFLTRVKPCVGLLMETEVWPNLIACAQAMKIPMALINARLSEKSLARGQKYPTLAHQALGALSLVLAQTSEDARRLELIGAPAPQALGNLKFDIQPSPESLARGVAWKKHFARPNVLLLANTREGEEAMLLSALKAHAEKIMAEPQGLLVLLVPRHPQRFNDVEQMIRTSGFDYLRRSSAPGFDTVGTTLDPKIQIVLGDSLGEMVTYYGAADLAVMGGSFENLGGHNLIEACACGCPVILGPHMFNFVLASEEAVRSGAAWSVADADAALQKALQLLSGDAAVLQDAAKACIEFSQKHRGATERTLAALAPLLPLS